MKAMSYTCSMGCVKEVRDWLLSMGLIVFRQATLTKQEPTGQPSEWIKITFFVPDEETETYLKLTYPNHFQDCSA